MIASSLISKIVEQFDVFNKTIVPTNIRKQNLVGVELQLLLYFYYNKTLVNFRKGNPVGV